MASRAKYRGSMAGRDHLRLDSARLSEAAELGNLMIQHIMNSYNDILASYVAMSHTYCR